MPAEKPQGPAGERIAKVLSRAGVASRREAERMIELGQVTVNGRIIDSPALNVTASDRITVNGQPLAAPEPQRLWLYYKPEGLVTSASDEKGRDTVFDHLPEDMPRVMSVGRLDLNSEGLLLLTNDGELKRRLELPSTGWLRKYRVRVNGNPTDPDLDPLRKGIVVEGERFQPMEVKLDRVQGANAWLTVGLREGRNREIRRALNAVGLYVNRLIRVSYGPFRLGELEPGEVEEVRARVLRDQLGIGEEETAAPPRKTVTRGARPGPASAAGKPSAGKTASVRPARGGTAAGEEEAAAPRGKTFGTRSFAARTPGDEPVTRRDAPGPRKPASAFKAGEKSARAKPGARPEGSDRAKGPGRAPGAVPVRSKAAGSASTPAGKSAPRAATGTKPARLAKPGGKPVAKTGGRTGAPPAPRKPRG